MAVTTLGSKAQGNIIKIKENGVDVEYLVVKHNYQPDLNGNGKTLVVRRYLYPTPMAWSNTKSGIYYITDYANTSINAWLTGTFYNTIQADIRNVIPSVSIKYVQTADEETETAATISRKVFLLSHAETDARGDSSYYVDGNATGFFDRGTKNIAYLESDTSTAGYWWLRSIEYYDEGGSYTGYRYGLRHAKAVTSTGIFSCQVIKHGGYYARPAFCLPASLLINESGYPVFNTAPTVPGSITYANPEAGKQMTVSWEASTDAEGNAITYTVERRLDSGSFVQVGQTTGLTMPVLIPSDQGATTITIRVKAADSLGLESAYRTGSALTISYNHTPTISGIDGSLGACTTAPTYTYTVDDEDAGDVLTVEESIETADGLTETLRTFTATRNQQYTVQWNCRCWLVCKPGTNKLIIRVTDSKGSSATRTMTFNRPVGRVSAARAVSTDAMPAKVLLSLYPSPAELPGDCTIEAYVTNNPFDDSPVWEDVSGKLNMTVHTFSNSTAANGYGLGYKFCITRDVETVEFYQAVLRFA